MINLIPELFFFLFGSIVSCFCYTKLFIELPVKGTLFVGLILIFHRLLKIFHFFHFFWGYMTKRECSVSIFLIVFMIQLLASLSEHQL